jgi:hypothetical protein
MQSTKNPNQTFCTIINTQYSHLSRVYHATRLKTNRRSSVFLQRHPRLMRIDRKLQANGHGKDQTNSRKGQERELANQSSRLKE